MCIAIAGLGSAIPNRQELLICCTNNPDGFGWGIVSDAGSGLKDLRMDKGMIKEEMVDGFLAEMSALGDTVIAWTFHARIFTHGAVSLANTHPFYLGDDAETIVCHNGILPVTIAKGDTRSDSRVFAEDYLTALGGIEALNSVVVSDLVEGFVYGCNSKVVILTSNPVAEYSLVIFGESGGHWRNKEIWFSNHSYETPTYATTANFRHHTARYTEWESECPTGFAGPLGEVKKQLLSAAEAQNGEKFIRCADINCGSFVSEFDDYCSVCGTCQMCERDSLNCLCYNIQPAKSRIIVTEPAGEEFVSMGGI